jgi:hypothetical protein
MTTCKGCCWLVMTWAESRRSYARLIAHGLSAEGAKSKSLLCHHCAGEQKAGGQQTLDATLTVRHVDETAD